MSFPKSIWSHLTVLADCMRCWPASLREWTRRKQETHAWMHHSGLSYGAEKKAQISPGWKLYVILIMFVNMQPGWKEKTESASSVGSVSPRRSCILTQQLRERFSWQELKGHLILPPSVASNSLAEVLPSSDKQVEPLQFSCVCRSLITMMNIIRRMDARYSDYVWR